MKRPTPTGCERTFPASEFIVSKTDVRGRITYANRIFREISGFSEEELLGRPHSIVRHPDMPMAVYQLLWSRIQAGHEVFAYVVNLCKEGDHYWVYAHVTPTFDRSGQIMGFHSNRRAPDRGALDRVTELYAALRAEERRHESKRDGLRASSAMLEQLLHDHGMDYDAFVWSLADARAA